LTPEAALKAANAALVDCRQRGFQVAVAVTDRAGVPLVIVRDRHAGPHTLGFGDLARAATRDGALDKKTKELIALALGVAAHCDACIGFHAKALVQLGATKAEVEEALGMAVYMGGGPSLMYSANAVAAFEEFAAAAQ